MFDRFIYVDSFIDFGKGVYIFPCKSDKYPHPKGNDSLCKVAENGLQPDDFDHELTACFGTKDLLVYTGCAHNGILNILDLVKTYVHQPVSCLIGGFHLLDGNEVISFENDEEIDDISKAIHAEYPETYLYTGHCTGNQAFKRLKTVLGSIC